MRQIEPFLPSAAVEQEGSTLERVGRTSGRAERVETRRRFGRDGRPSRGDERRRRVGRC